MICQLLEPEFQQSLIQNHVDVYFDLLKNFMDDLEDPEKPEALSQEFLKIVEKTLRSPNMKKYSPENYHFLHQLLNIIDLLEVLSSEELTDHVQYWKSTEHSADFHQALDCGSVIEASRKALVSFERSLITYSHTYILGDLKDNSLSRPLIHDNQQLNIFSQSPKTNALVTKTCREITQCLDILKNVDLLLYKTFFNFSQNLYLIDEPGIVSYSMQSLPTYSYLNVVERDFVDRIDDLVHENGHHYLNRLSEQVDLFEESDDEIFFSPWRRALRPIRAFYHAYFTFWWAAYLFKALSKSCHQLEYDEHQKQKIYRRYIEESAMMEFCYGQLEWAREQEILTETGYHHFQIQRKSLQNDDQTEHFFKLLNNIEKEKYFELKGFLEESKKYLPC